MQGACSIELAIAMARTCNRPLIAYYIPLITDHSLTHTAHYVPSPHIILHISCCTAYLHTHACISSVTPFNELTRRFQGHFQQYYLQLVRPHIQFHRSVVARCVHLVHNAIQRTINQLNQLRQNIRKRNKSNAFEYKPNLSRLSVHIVHGR